MTIDWNIVSLVVNGFLAVFSILLGALIRSLATQIAEFKAAIAALRLDDATMAGKIAGVELLVAGQYIKRDEFNGVIGKLEGQWQRELSRIESQIAARRASDIQP